jgi:glycosyltransferase involved in cell wall biosynthesis
MVCIVSVVMTSYNHEKYLSGALDSVLNQTFQDFELIVVDDASSDGSREIIRQYQRKDSRIRTIFHDRNMGISLTTNDGFNAAAGEYVAYVQSDDLWLPEKLEKQLQVLEHDPNLIVWSDAAIIDGTGKPTGRLFTEKYKAVEKQKSGNLFPALSKSNYICGQSMILKTAVAQEIRFDPKLVYANDYKFMLQLSRKYEFYFMDEPLVQYRIHGDNSISKNKDVWAKDGYHISRFLLKNHFAELPSAVAAKLYARIGLHLHNQGHPKYAQKCFQAAIRNNFIKTSYYKKSLKSMVRHTIKGSDIFKEIK